jgi:hypothetical protein
MPGRALVNFLLPCLLPTLMTAGAFASFRSQPVPAPADPKHRQPAHDAAPAAAPEADPTTPKGALKLLAAALRDGDAERIRQVMYATNPAEVRMVAAMADMARAMAELQKVAVKAFGEEGAQEIVGDSRATDAEGRARIDAADVRVQGDTATVVVSEGQDAPVTLRRVNGQWKVPMAELSKNADPAALDERLTELAEQRKLVEQLAQEIGERQFGTPAQATDAWQSRAMQAVTRRPPAPRKPRPEGAKGEQESSTPAGDASARPASSR